MSGGTHFIPFGLVGEYINPDNVYKITQVTDTVTFTLVMPGMGAGSIFFEAFVFGSEQDAIDAVAEFIVATIKGQLTFAEAVEAITGGYLANPQLTLNTYRNNRTGTAQDKSRALNDAIIKAAQELVIQFEVAV